LCPEYGVALHLVAVGRFTDPVGGKNRGLFAIWSYIDSKRCQQRTEQHQPGAEMFKLTDFRNELKKDNPHYERIKKSALHDLVALLERAVPKATPGEVAAEMRKIPDDKWRKYAKTKSYLLRTFPGLSTAYAQAGVALGESVPGYFPGKKQRQKDVDGKWHEFVLQRRGNSCGPACVLMVKTAFHPPAKAQLGEPEVRGTVALFEQGKIYQGISSLSTAAISMHNWNNVGSNRAPLIQTLHAQPFPVPSARAVSNLSPADMLAELRRCTRKTPGIVGWNWQSGGGHWTVCAGATDDNSRLIILDPWDGVQYVQNDLANYRSYQNGAGTLDLSDPTLTHGS